MIGVVCEPRQEPAVREFFQLFKTPWEMLQPGTDYDAVLISDACADEDLAGGAVEIRLGDGPCNGDAQLGIAADDWQATGSLITDGGELPLYRGVVELTGPGRARGWLSTGAAPVVVQGVRDGHPVVRCGYNLFDEVEFMLTAGQPVEHAATPTLDLHVELLRAWLVDAGVELVELTPTPPGCGLLATLTHDVDFMGIRRHTHDRTLLGFVYRASIGSVIDRIRGRGSVRRVLQNWWALASLPLVHLGVLPDFWLPFKRYAQADEPWRSTFFVVPFRGRAGTSPHGEVSSSRAVAYAAGEIAPELRALVAAGHEVAVHGIDAWRDCDLGCDEHAAVSRACGEQGLGVRMHWLYFDATSVGVLEGAGFDYDATFGYNDTVGFRAGTSQVFAPLGAERLLELPLHIQDTSLLYPTRMYCREAEAVQRCAVVINKVRRHGGVATVSWHERSLAPERLWDGVYARVLALLRADGASVRPARDVVAWFRVRRSIDLEGARIDPEAVTELAIPDAASDATALRVRVHHPPARRGGGSEHTDIAVTADALATVVRHAGPVRS